MLTQSAVNMICRAGGFQLSLSSPYLVNPWVLPDTAVSRAV